MVAVLIIVVRIGIFIHREGVKEDAAWKASEKTENWTVESVFLKDYAGKGVEGAYDRPAMTYVIKNETGDEWYLIPRPQMSNNLAAGQKLIVTRHGVAMTSVRIGDKDTSNHYLEWSSPFPFKPR